MSQDRSDAMTRTTNQTPYDDGCVTCGEVSCQEHSAPQPATETRKPADVPDPTPAEGR